MARTERLALLTSVLLVVIVATALVSRTPEDGAAEFLTLGTGPLTGLYYPTGGAIARLVNRRHQLYGFRLLVEPTEGALSNVEQVLAGHFDFAISQADLVAQAVRGEGPWQAAGPQAKLRAVASLLPETVVLVATAASRIEQLADLQGRRVDLGRRGSGRRKNAQELLRFAGLDWGRDLAAAELTLDETVAAFAAGELDAAFLTVGHPSAALAAIAAGSPVRFVPLGGEAFRAAYPVYLALEIPADLYPEAAGSRPVATVGTMAVLLTSVDVADDRVYAVASNLFENLDELRGLHPAFVFFRRERMLRGLSAPIHPGALRYLEQSGEDALVTVD